jgi:cation:H+ antiporter
MLAEIIPPAFFEARGDLLLWLMVAGAMAMLVLGADRVVASAAALAVTMGLSKVIIGATVVSLGTTMPEAVVSVKAAWEGDAGLALGNGVGSIICDTGLIFGLCCVLARLPADRFVLNRHGWLQAGAGAGLVAACLVLWVLAGNVNHVVIPRAMGFVLLALLVGYMYLSVRWSREHPEIVPDEAAAIPAPLGGAGLVVAANAGMILLGVLLVVGGSEVLIGSVREICLRLYVPEAVLAGTLVAFGTSLPELATAIASIVKGHSGVMVGNIIGADTLNVLFVIGASAAARPLEVEPIFFYLYFPAMIAVLALFRFYIGTACGSFRRWQGIPLLGIYAAFILLTLAFGRGV